MNSKRREKFADLLLDIAKYIITAILLATWFSDVSSWPWFGYATILTALILTISIGLSLYKDDNKQKKKRR